MYGTLTRTGTYRYGLQSRSASRRCRPRLPDQRVERVLDVSGGRVEDGFGVGIGVHGEEMKIQDALRGLPVNPSSFL